MTIINITIRFRNVPLTLVRRTRLHFHHRRCRHFLYNVIRFDQICQCKKQYIATPTLPIAVKTGTIDRHRRGNTIAE